MKEQLLAWLSHKSQEWERVRRNKRNTAEQKKFAEGCMMAFVSVEAWVQTYKPNKIVENTIRKLLRKATSPATKRIKRRTA